MGNDKKKSNIKSISGLMIFVCLAAIAWLIMNLSHVYTENLSFNIKYVDGPANLLIQEKNYSATVIVKSPGFNLLYYYLGGKSSKTLDVSLKNIKFNKIDDETYSYKDAYIKEYVAEALNITPADVTTKNEELTFTMYKLASKKVGVNTQTDITLDPQYNLYDSPEVIPDSTTIYGGYNVIKNIDFLNTKVITAKNPKEDIHTTVDIILDENVYCDISSVDVNIDIEMYTESETTIPISTLNNPHIHLFQDYVKVKYTVALKDYSYVSNLSFKAEIDTTTFMSKEKLPVKLTLHPNNTTIIDYSPKEVEYFMTK